MELLNILSTIVGVVGIAGNTVVCLVVWRIHNLHTLTNVFIFNQAVADFLCSLALLLYATLPSFDSLPSGIPGVLLCYVWVSETTLWLFMNTSSVSLAALTLERYLAIVFPLRYRKMTSTRRPPAVAISLTWIIGFGLGCITSISLVDYSEADNRCRYTKLSPTSDPVHGLILALYLVYFTTTAATMLVAYIHICVALKRSARLRIRPGSMPPRQTVTGRPQEHPLLRARRNVIRTLTLVFAVYIVCWLPNEVMSAVGTTGQPLRLSVLLVASNSCVNPIIYSIKYRSFRIGLKQLFSDCIWH